MPRPTLAFLFIATAALTPAAARAVPLQVPGGGFALVTGTQVHEGGVNGGTVQINPGGNLVNAPGGGALVNVGTLASVGTLTNANDFTNLGTVINSGTVNSLDLFANFATVTNLGGLNSFSTLQNSNVMNNFGAVRVGAASLATNRAASVINNNVGGQLRVEAGSRLVNDFAATIVNRGTLTLDTAAQFNNSGTLRNEATGVVRYNAGTTSLTGKVVNNGQIVNTGGKIVIGGELSGAGLFSADKIDLTGFFSIGNSVGLAEFEGDVTFGDGFVLTMEISDDDRGDAGDGDGMGYDALDIDGALTIMQGAQLEVQYVDGYQPSLGDSFDVFLASGEMSGGFGRTTPGWTVTPMSGGFGDGFTTALRMEFVGVPEPATVAVFGLGLLGLAGARRYGRSAT